MRRGCAVSSHDGESEGGETVSGAWDEEVNRTETECGAFEQGTAMASYRHTIYRHTVIRRQRRSFVEMVWGGEGGRSCPRLPRCHAGSHSHTCKVRDSLPTGRVRLTI